MRLFLTHVDTPYRMYREGLAFSDTRLMLSAWDMLDGTHVSAICALWCDHRLDDHAAWRENRLMRVDAKCKLRGTSLSYTFSLEDARLLGDAPTKRLSELYDDGVRFITPMWRGVNRLGGAFDTSVGLTDYGRAVIASAMEMGILIDLSHASDESACEILTLAKHYRRAVCATHSNFRSVTPHPRNLTDKIAVGIAESGGFIGLCLVPEHVGGEQDINALIAMYVHGQTMGLGDILTIGSDFDGTDRLISPLEHASDLRLVMDAMLDGGFSKDEIEGLFCENALRIISHHFPCLFP